MNYVLVFRLEARNELDEAYNLSRLINVYKLRG